MTRKKVFILLLSCSVLSVFANTDSLFKKANEQYKKGQIEQAFESYKKIPEKTAAINYNLGNCAYKLGKQGYALLYWRRAEQDLVFWGRFDLLENILLLKENTARARGLSDKKNRALPRFFRKASIIVHSFLKTIPLIVLQILFLFLWAFLFLYLRFLYRRKQTVLITLLFIVSAVVGILMIMRYGVSVKKRGIIVDKKISVLSGPSKYFQPIGFLFEADEVIIKKESGEFVKVKRGKVAGWAQKRFVEKIEE
jgi:tetratricopeptide (TPR) repeat protein